METPDLAASLQAFAQAVRLATPPAMTLADDPFEIEIPPIRAPVSGDVDPPTLAVLAGLYLIAQLEQTGMLRVGELLIDNRVTLDLRSIEAAQLLDELATERRDWYGQEVRDQLYARVFGVGAGASDANANRAFPELLLDLCSAIESWADASRFGMPTAPRRDASVRVAAGRVRNNLAFRQHGNTVTAARRIAAQVRGTYELLGHPGVLALVAGRSMWDVVRAVWSDGQPDIDRHVTLGQTGQHLIAWIGSASAASGEPGAETIDAAALWLMAAGFELGAAA